MFYKNLDQKIVKEGELTLVYCCLSGNPQISGDMLYHVDVVRVWGMRSRIAGIIGVDDETPPSRGYSRPC